MFRRAALGTRLPFGSTTINVPLQHVAKNSDQALLGCCILFAVRNKVGKEHLVRIEVLPPRIRRHLHPPPKTKQRRVHVSQEKFIKAM